MSPTTGQNSFTEPQEVAFPVSGCPILFFPSGHKPDDEAVRVVVFNRPGFVIATVVFGGVPAKRVTKFILGPGRCLKTETTTMRCKLQLHPHRTPCKDEK
ncbi:Cyclic nucleotide-binding domain (CNMP-BD) protein [Anopheles sinensis]|uniref:Cyclic nucleotide-binding domain (CNMP-BD) protein n=1 Tax=Anopheles sinensis TaxID=74873 RepID=A0A084VIC8_ANOSI|nr:Cyclic nucleotide-binding domain (CNMP-BD) protein [Anopheles sinensis]